MSRAARRFGPYALLLPGLLFLGIAFLLPLLLSVKSSLSGVEGGIFSRYGKILTDPFFQAVIGRTLWVALVVTALCLLFGYPVAFWIARQPGKRSTWLLSLAVFPLLVNAVVRSFSWMVLLGSNGLISRGLLALGLIDKPTQFLYTPVAVIVGTLQLFLPLMILSLYSSIAQIDTALEPAARGLGASGWTTFRRILFPLSIPGVMVGVTLVFSACMTAFTTPQMLGGSRQMNLPMLVYNYANVNMDWPLATTIALLMFAMTLVIVLLQNGLVRQRR